MTTKDTNLSSIWNLNKLYGFLNKDSNLTRNICGYFQNTHGNVCKKSIIFSFAVILYFIFNLRMIADWIWKYLQEGMSNLQLMSHMRPRNKFYGPNLNQTLKVSRYFSRFSQFLTKNDPKAEYFWEKVCPESPPYASSEYFRCFRASFLLHISN
jgi:hypothetical protein